MSKVNPIVKNSTKMFETERLAGGHGLRAAAQSNYDNLRRCVLANLLWEDVAYMDGKSVAGEIKRLVGLCTGSEVASLAIEARDMQKLRHTPLFLISEMAKHEQHAPYIREALAHIITRADMLTDFVAIYWKDGKKPLTAQVRKGLADAFHNFDEYQFAKYDRDAEIKLRDVLRLVHPKPRDEKESELFSKIASRTLKTPDTWEVALSSGKDKLGTWTRLINERKLGALALFRNIRNMRDAHVSAETISKAISNANGAMLLPLDYLKASQLNNEFARDIEDKMIKSYANLPKLPGRTLFIVDVSGSMGSLTSSGSVFSRLDQACAMATLAVNQCESYKIVATAGSDSRGVHATEWIEYPVKGFGLRDQIVDTKNRIGGGGIFTRQCLNWCKDKFGADAFDRIIVFSDSQDCDFVDKTPHPFAKYNYICDVSAHTKGINYKGCWTAEISGWSEHFLTYIAAYEGIENSFNEE